MRDAGTTAAAALLLTVATAVPIDEYHPDHFTAYRDVVAPKG